MPRHLATLFLLLESTQSASVQIDTEPNTAETGGLHLYIVSGWFCISGCGIVTL